ncbi:hypothetical protein [uncultured Pseudoalteromonas sp.]|uniref:hypothetical protein n=1 Tax=uncultured Pseudoalteromonas sp. TaxID=114053 RepID=UPI002593B767|nr:hypothetical protein [uncultured Pseudoalteromonas sp.]
MAKLKVELDPKDPSVLIYGTYRYNTYLGVGQSHLSKVSKRKDYPDILSYNRSETCILEAIKNYKAEVQAGNEVIRRRLS